MNAWWGGDDGKQQLMVVGVLQRPGDSSNYYCWECCWGYYGQLILEVLRIPGETGNQCCWKYCGYLSGWVETRVTTNVESAAGTGVERRATSNGGSAADTWGFEQLLLEVRIPWDTCK